MTGSHDATIASPVQTSIPAVNPGDYSVREGIYELSSGLPLHFGGRLTPTRVAWRLEGATSAPVIAVLGGISAGRYVASGPSAESSWWANAIGPGRALDTRYCRVLGIDYIGGSGASTGPQRGENNFPSVSAYDQAAALALLAEHLEVPQLYAIVGASYGGMVALAFAERYPRSVAQLIAISAADKSHPLSTAWRSVQRAIVRYAASRDDGAEGLKLARALAMVTYRSAAEFSKRFDAPAQHIDGQFVFPVEKYLCARGDAYARSYIPEAFVCLSESIDLHRIEPQRVKVPTTLVAVREDQLVPLGDMQALQQKLGGPCELIEISSLFGHDAFLKEAAVLEQIFRRVLKIGSAT